LFCAILSLKDRQEHMAIKEPVFSYRKYRVTPNVDYIPCLPVKKSLGFVLQDFSTATRIPKGAEVTFVAKYDNDLVEVRFTVENSKEFYHVLVMSDFICENLLPIFRKN